MEESIVIRVCGVEDAATIRELSERTFRETFDDCNTVEDMAKYVADNLTPEQMEKELDEPQSTFMLAFDGELPVGYMKLNLGSAQTEKVCPGSLEIERLYILKSHKGQHIGATMMEIAFAFAKVHGLEYVWLGVWEHNEPAKAFYAKKGFEPIGSHTFVLGNDPQTDILMKKTL